MIRALLITAALILGLDGARAAESVGGERAFSFIALGDMPYNVPADYARFDRLIAAINTMKPSFSIHVGDIKSGSSPCDDSVYTQGLAYLNSLKAPAAFTPGDNDWTDCDRQAGVNSLERLDHERALFFSTPFTQGQPRPLACLRRAVSSGE